MKKKKILIIFFIITLFLNFISNEVALASKGSSLGVKPIYPENQIDGKQPGYFNLLVTPSQEQDIEIYVSNDSNEEIKVKLTCNQATTSDEGVVIYNGETEPDKSSKYSFVDIATLENDSLTIPPQGREKAKIHLKIPADEFQGKIIGGITAVEDRELNESEKKQTVTNEFQYAVPIVLQENEDQVDPNLDLTNISPVIRNGRPYIEATIVNDNPINITKMDITGKIYNTDEDTIYIERNVTNFAMAPNSSIKYGFDLENSNLKQGKYLVDIFIDADGKTFKFRKDFTITKEEAQNINKNNLYKDENNFPMWAIILISVVVIIVVITLSLYFIKIKKQNKKIKNKIYKNRQ